MKTVNYNQTLVFPAIKAELINSGFEYYRAVIAYGKLWIVLFASQESAKSDAIREKYSLQVNWEVGGFCKSEYTFSVSAFNGEVEFIEESDIAMLPFSEDIKAA